VPRSLKRGRKSSSFPPAFPHQEWGVSGLGAGWGLFGSPGGPGPEAQSSKLPRPSGCSLLSTYWVPAPLWDSSPDLGRKQEEGGKAEYLVCPLPHLSKAQEGVFASAKRLFLPPSL
jgi:hypothetical protein